MYFVCIDLLMIYFKYVYDILLNNIKLKKFLKIVKFYLNLRIYDECL